MRIIESAIEYIITERFKTPLLWIHLSKSPLFLKSLIDSGSPYVILFSCLVVQIFFIYIYIYIYIYNFIFNALLNVYQQGYAVCNLFFLIFFIFLLCNHIHRKKNAMCNTQEIGLRMNLSVNLGEEIFEEKQKQKTRKNNNKNKKYSKKTRAIKLALTASI